MVPPDKSISLCSTSPGRSLPLMSLAAGWVDGVLRPSLCSCCHCGDTGSCFDPFCWQEWGESRGYGVGVGVHGGANLTCCRAGGIVLFHSLTVLSLPWPCHGRTATSPSVPDSQLLSRSQRQPRASQSISISSSTGKVPWLFKFHISASHWLQGKKCLRPFCRGQ